MPRLHSVRTVVAVIVLGVPVVASAQSVTLTGLVHAFGDSLLRLPGVDLALTPSGRTTRSDSAGAFIFRGLAPGEYRLTARRVGYDSLSMRVVTTGDRMTTVNVALRKPAAQALGTVTIEGRRVTYPARFAEPYRRLSQHKGYFWTTEMIDSLFPADVHSLLMRVPGVHENGRTIAFARCSPQDGHVQVWVDGVRRTRYSTESPGAFLPGVRGGGSAPQIGNVGAVEAVSDIVPSSMQLMEVYSGVARVPGEFLHDACAVILIWTKSY